MSFQLSLSTESVSSAYPDKPLFVVPTSTVGEALQSLQDQTTGCVLVCEKADGAGKLLGIFTERDALKCMAAASDGSSDIMEQPVSTVMSTDLATLQPDASMGESIKKMSQGGFRHLPIVDSDTKPVGMETVNGIVHYLVDHFPQTIYNLPPNPDSIPTNREGA